MPRRPLAATLVTLLVASLACAACSASDEGAAPSSAGPDAGGALADAADASSAVADTCLGSADLCERRYPDVTFAATHNAFSYAAGGPVQYLYPNQDHPIADQLAYGIRGLGIRPCPYFGKDASQADVVYVTHNSSLKGLLGEEPLLGILEVVKGFLDAHPGEIVTLFAESTVTPAQIAAVFEQAGLGPYLYTHDGARGWPTLREMIASGARLVVFNDSRDAGRPAWQHYLWDHIVDTDYNVTDASQFSCAPYRGAPTNDLYFLNQFIYQDSGGGIVLPSAANAAVANEPAFVRRRAVECWRQQSHRPSFVYVDWYGQGDVAAATRALTSMTGSDDDAGAP